MQHCLSPRESEDLVLPLPYIGYRDITSCLGIHDSIIALGNATEQI